MPKYIIGSNAPVLTPDIGAGIWCSVPQTAKMLAYKRAIQAAMGTGTFSLLLGSDAVKHFEHYLDMTGSDYILDLPELIKKSEKFRDVCVEEEKQAIAFCETLSVGMHDITSSSLGHGYFSGSDRNLYYAIGGYSFWGQGYVSITKGVNNNLYELDFAFSFYDRYNWDVGKPAISSIGLTDDFFGEFHKACYAKEFDMKGEYKKKIRWSN